MSLRVPVRIDVPPKINPYTGYPFRTENLDDRIARLRPDFIKLGYIKPSIILNKLKSPADVLHSPSTSTAFTTPTSIKISSSKNTPSFLSGNYTGAAAALPSSTSSSPAIILNKLKPPADAIHSPSTSTAFTTPASIKISSSKYTPSFSSGNYTGAAAALPSSTSSSPAIILNKLKRPADATHSSSPSTATTTPATTPRTPMLPPPIKRPKKEYKHSFTFIKGNSKIKKSEITQAKEIKEEQKLHRSIFRHVDDKWKREPERKKAYQELSKFCEQLWPNPKKLWKYDKVTTQNVNEFVKDDVYKLMLDKALNNLELYEAHEVIFAKNRKPKEKKTN